MGLRRCSLVGGVWNVTRRWVGPSGLGLSALKAVRSLLLSGSKAALRLSIGCAEFGDSGIFSVPW